MVVSFNRKQTTHKFEKYVMSYEGNRISTQRQQKTFGKDMFISQHSPFLARKTLPGDVQ